MNAVSAEEPQVEDEGGESADEGKQFTQGLLAQENKQQKQNDKVTPKAAKKGKSRQAKEGTKGKPGRRGENEGHSVARGGHSQEE